MAEKIKSFRKNFVNLIIKNRYTLYLAIPFIMMDLVIRIMGYKIGYFPTYYPVPNIFTIIWIVLFLGIITSLKGAGGKIAYWVLFSVFFVLFLTNAIYYSLTSFYFSFNLLLMAGEGSSYILDTIIKANPLIYVISIIIIILAVIVYRKMPKQTNYNFKRLTIIFLLFAVMHLITPMLLGSGNSNLKWSSFRNPRNVYESYSDSNKSMRVSGLYEYSLRNFFITFLKP